MTEEMSTAGLAVIVKPLSGRSLAAAAPTHLKVEGCAADRCHSSAVFAPASCSRKIPLICSSVNRFGFMSIPLRGDRLYQFWEEIGVLRSVRSFLRLKWGIRMKPIHDFRLFMISTMYGNGRKTTHRLCVSARVAAPHIPHLRLSRLALSIQLSLSGFPRRQSAG